MKKNIYYFIFSIIALVIQLQFSLYFPGIKPAPDFLLIIVVFAALLSGVKTGFFLGLIIGLIQDLYLGGIFGIYTISKAVVGVIAGLMEGKVYKKNILIPPIIIFIISIIHELLLIPLSERLLFKMNIWYIFKNYIINFSLHNSLLAFVLYIIIYFIYFNRRSYYE
mgnify:CR=1 FL=1